MPGDKRSPQRGEVWWADLRPIDSLQTAEVRKSRPVLIIGNNIVNSKRKTVLVVPLSTSGGTASANPPITVHVNCGGKQGIAVIDQLRALDKARLINLIDNIKPSDLAPITQALRQVLEIS